MAHHAKARKWGFLRLVAQIQKRVNKKKRALRRRQGKA